MAATSKITIQYYRSAIGFSTRQKQIVKGLGFGKLNSKRELIDTPSIRGMIAKVPHLVRIFGLDAEQAMTTGTHTFKPNKGATHKRKRVGRGPGSGHGKTATRGHNGQWSRAGTHSKRGFEGGQMPLHRRIPKRGFSNASFAKEHTAINVSDLARFEGGAKVGPKDIVSSGLARKIASHGLRVLGDGKIDRVLHVSAHYFTPSAKEKIENAGGTVEVIGS